jgi:hypothetical protein
LHRPCFKKKKKKRKKERRISYRIYGFVKARQVCTELYAELWSWYLIR